MKSNTKNVVVVGEATATKARVGSKPYGGSINRTISTNTLCTTLTVKEFMLILHQRRVFSGGTTQILSKCLLPSEATSEEQGNSLLRDDEALTPLERQKLRASGGYATVEHYGDVP